MADPGLPIPTPAEIRRHLLQALRQYWERELQALEELPVTVLESPVIELPLRLQSVTLPDWAEACGVSGTLLVPAEACKAGDDWQQVDWWLAGFLLLEGWHERVHEQQHGPIHSYSFKLSGWDERIWRHAWVNRIAIFLRLWAANNAGVDADSLFGSIPAPRITMTHDVDAVRKTMPIRLKQGGFNLLNTLLQLSKGHWQNAGQCLGRAMRFIFGWEDWWKLDELLLLEEGAGIRSRFHFYADARPKTPKRWLFDPGYDVTSDRIRDLIGRLSTGGWRTGLHQSFDAWESDALIRAQRQRLIDTTASEVSTCRQHWLRFGWNDTWLAQGAAGLEEDTTLMFNDRMGFRSSAAVAWHPWNPLDSCSHTIRALPTVLMDSHAYDYEVMSDDTRHSEIRHWINELQAVGGRCAVLWHPHTLTDDYGWKDGFEACIDIAAEMEVCVDP